MTPSFTYMHVSSSTGLPFYVGKGSLARAHRKARRSAEWKAIADLGYEVKILAQWPSDNDAYSHEHLIIKCFRDMGIVLCNKNNGGHCGRGSGWPMPESQKAKIGEANARLGRRPMPQAVHDGANARRADKDAMAAFAIAQKERFQCPSIRAKLRESHLGQKQSPETVAKKVANSAARRASVDGKEARRQANARRYADPAEREKTAAAARAKWSNPEYRAMMLAARKPQ